MSKAPTFLETFADGLKLSISSRGARAFVPIWLIASIGLPYGVWFVLGCANLDIEGNVVSIFAALLATAAFLGAVSVNAMREIFSLVGNVEFGRYLKDQSVFDQYIFWPQYTLFIQFVAIGTVLISFFLMGFLALSVSHAYLVSQGVVFYACVRTWFLVDLVRTLAWHRQEYLVLLSRK